MAVASSSQLAVPPELNAATPMQAGNELAQTIRVSRDVLAPRAMAIDEGHYPLDVMAKLGEAGAFGFHLRAGGERFDLAIGAMEEISRACGSTGFLTWAHDVCGLYLEQSENASLFTELLGSHTQAHTFGGTALSNPMKAFAGIEPMLLKARRVPGGYTVSGSLPWVSHIAEGQYCGAIAQVLGGDGAPSHEIMFLLRFDGRAKLRHCPKFSGMEGTSTWGVTLEDFHVSENDLIADPARPFIKRIRGAFVLLQAGMALGICAGSIDDIRAVQDQLGHVNQFLHDGANALEDQYGELRAQAITLAATPYDPSDDFFMNVLDMRAAASEFVLRAAQSALIHQGARGYLASAAPQRRIRESHFVAIVTPAIKHLRSEMARLAKEVQPAHEVA